MGELLGLGISHWPRLREPLETYPMRLVNGLRDPAVSAAAKDPANWPPAMRAEWSTDRGAAAAVAHQTALLASLRRVRAALDAFAPDAIVVWGDDQYENFREDVVPAFAVLAYDDVALTPQRLEGSPWNDAAGRELRVRANREVAKYLASGLLENDFDVAYAYRPLHQAGLSHAFENAVIYLDPDRAGFPYPLVPVTVNCYGRYAVSARGGLPSAGVPANELDPPSPSPRRCFDLGRATARVLRASPWRIALLASSSWSHAFLCPKHAGLYPDVPADTALYASLTAGDYAAWRARTLDEVVDAGQQEMLNWFCLAGAMSELGHVPAWSTFMQSYIFNSNKVAAIFAAA